MESVLPFLPEPRSEAEAEAYLDAILAELRRSEERSVQIWAEIDRLAAESRAVRARTDAKLGDIKVLIEQLKA